MKERKVNIWTGTVTSGEEEKNELRTSREGVVVDLQPKREGRGQRFRIKSSCVAACNPTAIPIMIICLDRRVHTHFTGHALTRGDGEEEKR